MLALSASLQLKSVSAASSTFCKSYHIVLEYPMLVLGIGPRPYKGKRDSPTRAFLLCQTQYMPSSRDVSNSKEKCDFATVSSYDASHRAPAIELDYCSAGSDHHH